MFLCSIARLIQRIIYGRTDAIQGDVVAAKHLACCRCPTLSTASLEPTWSKAMGVVAWVVTPVLKAPT
ncbi:hypothetical protein ACSS6W_001979 [Trichoderma asperelloides]